MASYDGARNRPFWDTCIALCRARLPELLDTTGHTWSDADVLWRSGPGVITTVYYEMKATMDMHVLNRADSLYSFSHRRMGTWRRLGDSSC